MPEVPVATGLVAAAGRGRRIGAGVNKVLLPLAGAPILAWTLSALRASPHIGALVIVVGEGDEEAVSRVCQTLGLECTIARGGETRADSVWAGLRVCLDLGSELVAIHDGARPFVSPEVIGRAVLLAAERGAAGAALPTSDTIKRVDSRGRVLDTPRRLGLRSMQTPQAFRLSIVWHAYELAGEMAATMTDDCEVVERAGYPVHLSSGDPTNLKITYDIDRVLAEAIAADRAKPVPADPTMDWGPIREPSTGID